MDRFIKKREDNVFNSVLQGECAVVKGWSGSRICEALGLSAVYIGTDTLRSQQNTESFFEFIKHGQANIVLDECEMLKNELAGFRWIRDNRYKYKSRIFIPSENGKLTINEYDKVIDLMHEAVKPVDEEKQDIFFDDTNEFIREIITNNGHFDTERCLNMNICEPGNRMGIVHANYTKSEKITMDEMSRISECMSEGDVLDTLIFSPMFSSIIQDCYTVITIIMPSLIIENRIPEEKITPATCWTKHFNMCLKKSQEKFWKYSDPDTMNALRYAPNMILEYCTHSKGVHLINHTSMGKKIDLKKIKEHLKEREKDIL